MNARWFLVLLLVAGIPTARAGAPALDPHFVAADDYFVAEQPLGGNSYVYVRLARQLQAPAAETKGQGKFLLVGDGKELWTEHSWKTRIATKDDIKLGQVVIIAHETEPGTSAYRAPASRAEATRTRWWMAKITDTSDLFKGQVTAAGSYPVRVDALRVAGEAPPAKEPVAASGEGEGKDAKDSSQGAKGDAKATEGAQAKTSEAGPGGEAKTTAAQAAPVMDAHFVSDDEWFASESPLGGNSYVYVRLAKQLQAPSEETKGQGKFFLIANGAQLWTTHFWRTRIANRDDVKLGQVVILSHETEPGTSAYRAAASRAEARRTRWWMAKITDTSDLFKGIVTVAGSYKARVDGLRVPR